MSTVSTVLNQQIFDYIDLNFTSEDDFLKHLRLESLKEGFPDIAIAPVQGIFLQFLLKSIKARYVLEIGSLAGYSAITMARALPENGKLIAVEMEIKFAKFIRKKAKQAGLENIIEVVNDDGISFLNSFNTDYQLDFVFLDAEKTEYLEYFNLVKSHVRKGGIIAADNALAFGEIANTDPDLDGNSLKDINAIREYNKTVKADKEFFTMLLPIGDGLLLAFKL